METLTGFTRYSKGLKCVALITVFVFAFEQIVFASPDPFSLQQNTQVQREISVDDLSQAVPASTTPDPTQNFLSETTPLTPVESKGEVHPNDGYESETYSFEEAIDVLRPEYAAAVIVDSLTEDNLKSLLDLDFEVGIAIIAGQLVLFSTGNDDEIGVPHPSRELLENADFISHTHILAGTEDGPSPFDLENAVLAPAKEYVLTSHGVYAYNDEGILYGGKPQSYAWYLEELRKILSSPKFFVGDPQKTGFPIGTFGNDTRSNDQVAARAELNEFIRQMDLLNEEEYKETQQELFRASSSEVGLTTYFDFEGLGGTTVTDQSGSGNTGILMNGVTTSTDSPNLNFATNTSSLNFDGVNDYVTTTTALTGPNVFSLAIWFKTTSTTGGKLIGFGNAKYGQSGNYDRHVYMSNSGQIYFGVWPGSIQTINSTASYNDGNWHHVAASLSSAGMQLYIDGNLIASKANITSAQIYTGYWKIGYDNLAGWVNVPSSFYFKGLMDDARIYNRALAAEEIQNLAQGNLPTPDTTRPVISAVTSTNLTSAGATIHWTTDEASDTQIEYGLTTAYGSSTSLDAALVTAHSQALSALQASTLYHYRVKSKDSAGNLQVSSDFTFTTQAPPATEAGLTTYFDFEGLGGTTVTDQSGSGNTGTLMNGVTTSADYPPLNFAANASSLNFDGVNDYVSTTTALTGSNVFSLALWFKTTSTTGGKLIGFGNAKYGQSGNYDRHVYMSNSGQIYFGVWPGSVQTINSTASYNDGNWHHVVASLSSAGMQLYIDGSLVASKANITSAQTYTGYWKVGYDNLAGWVNAPSSFYFKGLMDDARIYNRALAAEEIQNLAQGNLPTPGTTPPTVDSLPTYTNQTALTISGTKPMGTAIWINGVEAFPLNAMTGWSYSAILTEGANSFSITTKDNLGNQSTAVIVNTTLDTVLPTGSIDINSGSEFTNTTSVILNLSSSDTGSGIDKMSFSTDNISWSAAESYSSSKPYLIPVGDGAKTVYVKYYDKAGNQSAIYSKSITLDVTLPTGSIKINNDAATVTSVNVTLNLTGSDATSGIDQIRFSTDSGINWSVWENYAATKSFTLPSGDGNKTVQYELRDRAGNTAIFMDTIVLDTTGVTQTLSYDSTLTSASMTNFSGYPYVRIGAGSSSNTRMTQGSNAAFDLIYDITAAGSKSIALVSFDNPTTSGIEVRDLSALTDFVVGLKGPSGKVRLKVTDSLGGVSNSVELIDLSNSATRYYRISKTLFTGVDWMKITGFIYEVDSAMTTVKTGQITVSTKTLTYSTNSLTNLPLSPRTGLLSGSSAGTVYRVNSNASISLDFSLASTGDKSGVTLNFDNPSTTTTLETVNLSAESQFVFQAGGISSGSAKVEMEDLLGNKASGQLNGLGTSTKYYFISKDLFSSIDLTRVAKISFSIDTTQTALTSGALTFGAKTLLYSTVLASIIPDTPTALVMESSTASSYLTHVSSTQVKLNYNISAVGSNAGLVYSFDDLNTEAIESSDLSQGSTFTLGLKAGNSNLKKTRLEIEDISGNKASLLVNLTTADVYHTFQKSQFTGIDWTKVKRITLSVDQTMTTSSAAYVSWLQVTLNGFRYTPTLALTSSYTSANVSMLTGTPSLYLMPGSSANTVLSETTDKFTVNYDVSSSGSQGGLPASGLVAGARISFDKTNTADTVETVSYSSSSYIVFGASSTSNTLRVEFVDITGNKASVLLTGVQTTEKYFKVTLSSITGIDRSKIKWIQIYVDPVTNSNQPKTGQMVISIKGLTPPALTQPIIENTFNATMTKTSQVITGTKTAGTGIAINGVVQVKPDDLTVWRAEVGAIHELPLQIGQENIFQIQETNGAGVLGPPAQTTITHKTSLADGTTFTYSGNTLVKETTPTLDEIFYRADGSVEKFRYVQGQEIHYIVGDVGARHAVPLLQIYDSGANLTETIDIPQPSTFDLSTALKMTLEGGVEAFYVNGALKEMRTETGIRITDFTLDISNNIVNAYLVYPDKTIEMIRDGKLLRRVYSDGSIMDFMPSGFAVRNVILSEAKDLDPLASGLRMTEELFFYDKVSQTEIQETLVFNSSGERSRYDEKGILREVKNSTGGILYYSRTQDSDSYDTNLLIAYRLTPTAKTLIGASYDLNGVVREMRFQDGTKVIFTNGQIDQVLDDQGNAVADYDYLLSSPNSFIGDPFSMDSRFRGNDTMLSVTRSGIQFQYETSGFLSQIITDQGTITRVATDTDGDGDLTDEKITDLLLQTVDGNTLSDFELDANGNIIKGIITTKEGIKQTIANGVMTGFETVDGKIYDFANNEAILKEWKFRDGTRIIYGGGTIEQIIFPDQSQLHTIGFDPNKNPVSYVEEAGGNKKYFEVIDGKATLKRLETSLGAVIYYGLNGLAEKIDLLDTTQETIEYTKDAEGNILEITFVGEHTHHTYSPDGTLLNLLTDGVNAEFENQMGSDPEGSDPIRVASLFTRFGTVTAPDFSTDSILSGTIDFNDGTKQIIQNGVLVQTIRPTGTRINYSAAVLEGDTSGRIASLEMINGDVHNIIYSDNSDGSLKDAKLRSVKSGITTEFALVPYLLGDDNRVPSDPPHQMMVNGDSRIDSGTKKFGAGSLLLDGSSDTVTTPVDSDFNFGTGDFTVDFWVKFNSLSPQYLFTGERYGKLSINVDMQNHANVVINDGTHEMTGWMPASNAWYHVALVRKSGLVNLYVNGTAMSGAFNETGVINVSGDIMIGGRPEGGYYANGNIDEFRITKDALWPTNFPLPTSAMSQKDDKTVLLLHFDENVSDAEWPALGWDALPRPDPEIAEILFGRRLQNALSDRFNVESNFETGDDIFFAQIYRDDERGSVYEFGNEWSPEWDNVSVMFSGTNQGYITAAHTLGYANHHPQITGDFVDLNGDGLLDRIFMDPTGNFWWLQVNDGNKFLSPQKWLGVDKNTYPSPTDPGTPVAGSLRYMFGGSHIVIGDLIDITGDGLPDRIVQEGEKWYVQKNNGAGFDNFIPWEGTIERFSQYSGEGSYALEVRLNRDANGYKEIQEMAADLMDLDGDGLLDRVYRTYTGDLTSWLWQKNTGTGFDQTLLWKGVDTSFYTGPGAHDDLIAGAMSWYLKPGIDNIMADIADVIDMNGDGLPDRVLMLPKNSSDPNSALDWYVQFNNGKGFDPAVLWDDTVSLATTNGNAAVNSALRIAKYVDNTTTGTRHLVADLRDVTGDGLPDRVTVRRSTIWGMTFYTWMVERNTGSTFADAEIWTGISASSELEASLGQDADHFTTYQTPNQLLQTVDLKDINGDKIPDRLIFRPTESKWMVQLGTGSGFLPLTELTVEGLQTSTDTLLSSRYDYLHVSLKADAAISSSQGSVKVMLGDPLVPEEYQEWTIPNLTTAWQDFYLAIDKTKSNASQVKVQFIPEEGSTLTTAIYVENVTFTKFRPDAAKDWLNRMLTEENIITEIYSDRTQTLAQYLGLVEGDTSSSAFWTSNLDTLLQAETRIDFDGTTNDAQEFETFYGSVSKLENGVVTETTLPNGTKIQFSVPDSSNPNTVTQTVTKDGITETNTLSYGRVRSVERPGQSPLAYSYEFDVNGTEITVVFDPDTNITERYIENQLISRTQANGIVHGFEYSVAVPGGGSEAGDLIRTTISYKGRARATFDHSVSESGNKTVLTESGVLEEYDAAGTILFHTTPEGYRYRHSFERARIMTPSMTTETVLLPDGSTFTVDVPEITIGEEDPAGELLHQVTLIGFENAAGEAEYENGVLISLSLSDGNRIEFDRIETEEIFHEDTGVTEIKTNLLDARIMHADGTVTEFREGKPFSVTSATGRVIDISVDTTGELNNPAESAKYHHDQALQLWNDLVIAKWTEYQTPGTLPITMEYDMEGKLVTREFAEGVIELYSEGRIDQVIAPDGELLITYTYDSEGNPTKIDMGAARRRLEASILRLKADIAVESQKALARLAEREQVIDQTIEDQYTVARDKLLVLRQQIESQRAVLATIPAKGPAKKVLASAEAQIQVGINQVNAALEDLVRQRNEAHDMLREEVMKVRDQIYQETENAYLQIETEEKKAEDQILRQEISPIIYHWYRKILGRDPSKAEYDALIAGADYATGNFNLQGLKDDLTNSQELLDRTAEVNAIKTRVETELRSYITLSEPGKFSYASLLGISVGSGELVSLSQTEADSILSWLRGRTLHFGQSAYLALEALLDGAGISHNRVELASKLILIDILTGTLSPLEQGDLVISMFAMKRVAAGYGLSVEAYGMTYEALKAMYESQCGTVVLNVEAPSCNFRFVAHVNGDHYVIVTGISAKIRTELKERLDEAGNVVLGEDGKPILDEVPVLDDQGNPIIDEFVTYIDPGAGAENQLEQVTLTKEQFLETWFDQAHAAWGQDAGLGNQNFGFVLSTRGPPEIVSTGEVTSPLQSFVLSTSQSQEIRGAFFFLLIFAFIAIISAIAQAVAAIVTAIIGLISAVISGIGSIIAGFGQMFAGLFTGNFLAGLQAGFGSILHGLTVIGQGFLGVGQGLWSAGQAFVAGFNSIHGALLGGIHGFAGSIPFVGPALASGVATSAFANALALSMIGFGLQGVGILLEKMGVAPKIAQSLVAGGKIVIGVGLLATGNPLGLAASLGFVSGSVGEMLSLHTSLSPTLTSIISIGSTALSAFAVGGMTGGVSGAISTLTKSVPYLSMDLASAGITAFGNKLGWDPRITSLISIPVRTTVGSISGSVLNLEGYNDVVGKIFSDTTGGLVSLGASIGLDSIGTPPILRSFVPSLISGLVSGLGEGGGGPGGPDGSNPGNDGNDILKRIGNFAKNIGQTVVSGAKKVGQAVTSFGQMVTNGFGQAIEKVSNLIPQQIKEFFIGKGNGNLAVGVDAGEITSGNSVFGNYRLTYDNVENDLTFENERLVMKAYDVEIGQNGEVFVANIDFTEKFNNNITINHTYDSNGVLQKITLNDDLEILLNNNPFSTIEPLNFENVILRLRIGNLGDGSFVELKNINGKVVRDIKININKAYSTDEAISFINDLAFKMGALENIIGIPSVFADDQEKYKGAIPPDGKFAIKFYVERPYGNEFGSTKIITKDQDGDPSTGHVIVALADNEGIVIYRGLYPAESIIVDPSAPLVAGLFGLMQNISTVTSDVEGIIKVDNGRVFEHKYDVESDWYVISDEAKYNTVFNYLTQTDINYNLCFNSCAGFAEKAAELAGVKIPSAGFIPTTQDLADAFEEEQR